VNLWHHDHITSGRQATVDVRCVPARGEILVVSPQAKKRSKRAQESTTHHNAMAEQRESQSISDLECSVVLLAGERPETDSSTYSLASSSTSRERYPREAGQWPDPQNSALRRVQYW
jgi:hypothetical protein